MKNKNIRNVCIAFNIYALLQYLLISDKDVAEKQTIYYLNEGVSEKIRKKLGAITFPNLNKHRIVRIFEKIRWWYIKHFSSPFLNTAKIFAQDYQFLGAILIGHKSYDLLSDGPNCFTTCMHPNSPWYLSVTKKAKSKIGKIESFVFGKPYSSPWGYNEQCTCIHLTEENDSPLLLGKRVAVQSFNDLWCSAPQEKIDFILKLFDVSKEDMIYLSSRKILFLTQPFIEDSALTFEEYKALFTRVINHYGIDNIIVKTHPRDKFDYANIFPNIAVYSKPVGTQLLSLVGHGCWDKIATFFSSSVETFPESIEVDWLGVYVHPKLVNRYGETYWPNRHCNFIEL